MTRSEGSKTEYKVYLAGPIRGCSTEESTDWRERIKMRYSEDFTFIDPTDWYYKAIEDFDPDTASHELIVRDEQKIMDADAVLANMWRESIGTSIGICIASQEGIPVVLIDSNHLDSIILSYYADAICYTVEEGIEKIKAFETQKNIFQQLRKSTRVKQSRLVGRNYPNQ